jgi:hypothetical protein
VEDRQHGDRWEEADYAIRELGSNASAISLYWFLVTRRGRYATVEVGDALIHEQTDMPMRTIQYARGLLKERGFIRCQGGRGRGSRTRYTFLYPWRKSHGQP